MDKQSLSSMNDVSVWSLNAARLEWDFTQTGILISPHILQCKVNDQKHSALEVFATASRQ